MFGSLFIRKSLIAHNRGGRIIKLRRGSKPVGGLGNKNRGAESIMPEKRRRKSRYYPIAQIKWPLKTLMRMVPGLLYRRKPCGWSLHSTVQYTS
jgi:hypothetical protein